MNNIKPRQDRYALVTGASSGIGWHLSIELARLGYPIIAVSNQYDRLNELKSILETDFTIPVETLCMDLGTENAADLVYGHCVSKQFTVEVLVNNAGMMIYGTAMSVDIVEIKHILHLHMTTTTLLCHYFGQTMASNRSGYILNVSSISSVMPYPLISLYGPTKNYLRVFTKALRHELKPSGIQVTCLIPGATATALYDTDKLNMDMLQRFGLMKMPDIVAKKAIKALFKNRAEYIPGIFNKLVMIFAPMIPGMLIDWLYRTKFFSKHETE